MEMRIVVSFILAVAGILIVTVSIFALQQNKSDDHYPQGQIIITNKPDMHTITLQKSGNPSQGSYEYSAELPVVAKFFGTQKDDIRVIPIITFKGKDTKAQAFTLPKGEEYSGTVRASNIISAEPPTIKQDMSATDSGANSLIGTASSELLEGQTVVFQSDKLPDFSIRLRRLYRPLITLSTQCTGIFEIECAKSKTSKDLIGINACENTGITKDCEAVGTMCDSAIDLTADSVDCSQGRAAILFQTEYKGGADNLSEYKMDAGESIGISFWQDSDCVSNLGKVQDLVRACRDQRLGGPYFFTGPLIP